jgi:hypothetical protein
MPSEAYQFHFGTATDDLWLKMTGTKTKFFQTYSARLAVGLPSEIVLYGQSF